MITLNSPAPNFNLKDQDNTEHTLSDYKGKWVIIYFYPKDDTPGCTTEACSFRDGFKDLHAKNVQIFGISKDTVSSHKKFAEKFQLNFPLLSDPTKETMRAYGALGLKKFMGKEYEGVLRNTYLINPEGNIAKIYPNVTPKDHALEILKDMVTLEKRKE
ncbi:MAG: thioredoxin-dependent thiol peroxidase [bacterium]|nr:thioredoxin-dependent thiol peroxidase [bacterium]